MDNKETKDENQQLRQTGEEMLDSVSLDGRSLDNGHGSDVSSLASFKSWSVPTNDLNKDHQGATNGQGVPQNFLKRVQKSLTFGRTRRDHGTVSEEERKNTAIDPLRPMYVTSEGPLYVLTDRKNRNPVSLLCGQHEMDRERMNTEKCHFTENGQLVNSPPTSYGQKTCQISEKYLGTCSTFPIPFPTSASSNTPQYWETETAVEVKGRLETWRWWHVLEVGVVEEDHLDSHVCLYRQPRSWCVMVGWCDTHRGCCTQVWKQGKHVKCVKDTLPDAPGTSQTLRYGVVIDTVRGRVGFIDVVRGVVLEKMYVEFRQTIFPVFDVHKFPAFCAIKIGLVSGSDIQMTEDKEKLIYSCLT